MSGDGNIPLSSANLRKRRRFRLFRWVYFIVYYFGTATNRCARSLSDVVCIPGLLRMPAGWLQCQRECLKKQNVCQTVVVLC